MNRLPRRRAVVGLLAAGLVWGCSSETPTEPEPEPGPDLTVAAVTVTPETAVFSALGDTLRFTAEARNAAGEVLDAAFAWSSTDAGVVAVDTTGLAESAGGGTALIIATADGFADTSAVTVTLRTLVWAAAVDGSWHDPDRWRGGIVPTADDTARIAIAGDYTVTLAEDAEVARLVLGGGSGTQRLDTATGALAVGSLDLDGAELAVQGSATVGGIFAWRGGSVTGSGTLVVAPGGELRLGGGTPVPTLEATLRNEGIVAVVSGARLDIPATGVLENPAGSLIDFRSDGAILPFQGGVVVSAGTIRKSAGAGVAAFGASSGAFEVTGAMEIQSGALRIAGGRVLGTVDIAPGTRLEALGSITLGGDITFSNAGGLDIDGSVLIGDEAGQTITIPHVTLNSGIVGGTATIAVTDSLIWIRGDIAGEGELDIAAGAAARLVGDNFTKGLSSRSLRLRGNLTTGSGLDLLLDQGADIVVEGTGHWQQGYAGEIRQTVGSGSEWRLDGAFSKVDPETTTIAVPVVCTGSLLLSGGLLVLTDDFELTETGIIKGGGREPQPGQNHRLDLTQASGRILAGTLEPDWNGQPAWLDISGPVTLAATTVLRIDLADQDPIRGERLVFLHAALLAGTLLIERTLTPVPDEIFRVLTMVQGSGAFSAVTGAEGFDIIQDGNGVRLYWPPER